MNDNTLKTPDITPAQIVSVIGMLVGLFVSQGLIDNNLAQLVTGVASIVIPFAWMVADAVIRNGRSRALAANPPAQAENKIAG